MLFHSKQDILNIYYTTINICLDYVKILANDQEDLSNINNYLHTFNGFSHIETEYDTLGKVAIKIEKSYTKEEITLINKKGKVKGMYFDEECIIVNHDLVVAAVIKNHFKTIKSLAGYKENKNSYLNAICLYPKEIMDYAKRMKTWDLGRVVINFDINTVLHFFQCHLDIFKPFDSNEYEPNERKFLVLEYLKILIQKNILVILSMN